MNNLWKRRFSILIILLLSLVIFTLSNNEKTIKIAVIGTMTGNNSDLSISGRKGAEMAIYEINQNGGINKKNIELVIKDDKNDPDIALKMNMECINEGIKFIIGPYTSGMIVEGLEYLNDESVLILGPTISADSLSKKDDNFIRFIASTKEQANILTDMAKKRLDKNFIILFDERNHGFTDQLVMNFRNQFKEKLGTDLISIGFNPVDKGRLEDSIDSIKEKNPDGLFIIAGAEDCSNIAQTIKAILPSVQLYGPLWANTSELIKKGGAAVEGMILVGAIDLESSDIKLITFKENFIKRYGENPTFASMYSYEAVNALVMAITESRSENLQKVRAKLLEISFFKGIQDEFYIDSFGDNTRKYMIFIVHNGKLKRVE